MPHTSPAVPRPWLLPPTGRHARAARQRILMGRQGIFTADRTLMGYELLFRAPGRQGLRVDLWNARQQDRATDHVFAAAFFADGEPVLDRPAFINVTRTYLLDRPQLPCAPQDLVIELVESAFADSRLRRRVRELREDGYRIAVDDFVGTPSQVALSEHADFVKIDYRDLSRRGPELVDLARAHGSALVAERIETRAALEECVELGFELFQGHGFEPAITVERGHPAPLAHMSGSV